ncbi:MAG TPA: branched-chain amino acid ABC transporter permease [Desulfobacteraceae bacterium]|nr:branched-chain amino acid ABC transporter permease [Desulfobacteraceae bacterium]
MDLATLKTKKNIITGAILLVILILLATLPLYAPGYPVILLSSILMYVILTVGWVIFSAPTGYISLAPAAFFGVGIYTSAIVGEAIPFAAVVLIGGTASFCLALIVGALTLRLKGIYFAVFTFGLLMLISSAVNYYEIHFTGTRGRFVMIKGYDLIYLYMLGIFVLLMIAAMTIKHSRYGLALMSIGQEEEAAEHTGVNVVMVKVIVFAVSAFFMGAAGSVMATKWTYIDSGIAFYMLYSFMPVLMAIFGGMGQLYGPIIGSAIFTYLEEFLITRFPEVYMLIFGVILVIAILYLPDGLVGLIQKLWNRFSERKHAHT